jgi:hypothetical protein
MVRFGQLRLKKSEDGEHVPGVLLSTGLFHIETSRDTYLARHVEVFLKATLQAQECSVSFAYTLTTSIKINCQMLPALCTTALLRAYDTPSSSVLSEPSGIRKAC